MHRRIFRHVGPIAVLSAILIFPLQIEAGVITSGCGGGASCTFLQLLQGGTIQAGDLLFSGFTPFQQNGTTNKNPNVALITVTGLDDGGLDPGPGLFFNLNGQFSVTTGQFIDLFTTFLVGPALIDSNQIKDSSITLTTVSAVGAGTASGVEQTLYESSGGAGIYTHVVDVRPSENVNILMSSTTFPARDSVFNNMILRVYPGSESTGSASITGFAVRFSQQTGGIQPPSPAPEPGSLTLMMAGLLAAAAFMRKRKSV